MATEDVTGTEGISALDDEGGLIATLDGWFEESKTWMSKQRERWRKNEALYYGDFPLSLPTQHTQLKFNIPLSLIETEIPIIADYLPTFDIKPKEEDDSRFADQAQRRKTQLENQSRLRKYAIDAAHDSLVYSDGIICILPKLNAEGKFRGLEVRVADLFTWFPAPGSTSCDLRKSRYHIFATPMEVEEIRHQYGKTVEPEGFMDEYQSFHVSGEDPANTPGTKTRQALVKECYWHGEDREQYPFGRLTVWANGVLLEDGPLWEGADATDDYIPPMPYFKVSNYGTAHSLFGVGETYLVKTQAKCLSEIMSSLAESVKKTSNPVRKVLRSWMETAKKKIQGIAGEEVVVNSPADVSWETPPQIPASTFQFIETLIRLTDLVTGVHDVTEGRKPAGITAASAILALQEAAQARIRFKIAHEISDWMEEIGRFVVWIMKNYDTETTTIREETEEGAYDFTPYDPTGIADAGLDVEVVAGARYPSGRVADEERAKEKFLAGIYGIEEYANASSEPNKQKLIENWYRRQGLDVAMQRQAELNEAMQAFEPLVGAALEAPEAFAGSPEEEQAAKLLKQYPELLQTGEFEALPGAIKERMLAVFLVGGEKG